MLLHAAFFPPQQAAAELADLVHSISMQRREFAPVSVDDMHVHVTSFGNLTRTDASRLVECLTTAAAQWPAAPRLRMAGCSALAGEGDLSVCVPLAGEVDALRTIARGIPEAVQALGLHVDRRRFSPQVPVGEITGDTTLPQLESLVSALENYSGPQWVLPDLVLLEPSWASSANASASADIYAVIPLSAPRVS